MPKPILILAALLAASSPGLAAQTDYYARLGVIGSSDLLRDVIIDEVTVNQSIAPMLAVGGSLPIAPGYRMGLEGSFTSGGYHSDEAGRETDLGTLRTGSILLGLEGPVYGTVRWRAGAGALFYWPSEESGIFQGGAPTRVLFGAGADWRRPVLPKWDLMASLRYDFHRFTTDELERRGFSQTQGIGRISISVGLARGSR
jgi:hypothetical protein